MRDNALTALRGPMSHVTTPSRKSLIESGLLRWKLGTRRRFLFFSTSRSLPANPQFTGIFLRRENHSFRMGFDNVADVVILDPGAPEIESLAGSRCRAMRGVVSR